jgi:tetratricopeptide (TPR) repeat protein/predicted Ser/Thr protein kinase
VYERGVSSEVPEPRQAEASGPSVPRRIARFVVLGRIGSGGMGVVYEAWDPKLERRVALKLLPPEQRREEARNRLVREAQALARLAHPNVVSVYDVDVEGDAVWIAMEFVEGSTLRSWLKERSHSVADILAVVRAAGEGLAAAHAAGLVHRDFKPDNVLVGRDGRVRVVDFGLVRASDEPTPDTSLVEPSGDLRIGPSSRSSQQITRVGALVGTPGYMAPEQLRGRSADARADQFAFCVVVWEALFGERPFEGADLASLREAIEGGRVRAPRREPGVSERMSRALVRGLALRPEQRFVDMHALLGELQDEAARRPRPLLVLALVAVLVLGVLAAWWSGVGAGEQCSAGRVDAQQLWEARRRTSIAERFVSELPDAGEVSFARVDAAIEAWSDAWQLAWASTCEAREEQSPERYERRMDCLERQRLKVDAWLEALLDADAELIRAVPARLAWLPSVDACLRGEGMQTLADPSPAQREAVRGARDELAQLEARMLVHPAASLAPALAELRERARASDYPPLVAELLRVEGKLALAEGEPAAASERLREAWQLALASGHDTLALTCAIELIEADQGGDQPDHVANAERWHASALALSERLGHPPEAELELHLAYAGLLRQDTRYDDALAELDAAASLAARLDGGEGLRMLDVEGRRATVLQTSGRYAEARVVIDRVIAGLEAAVGPDHPVLLDPLGTRGNVAIAEGRHADGLREALRIREIAERSYGPTHTRTLRAMAGMATMHSLRGEQAQARATFEELLARLGERERVDTKSGSHATMGLCATLLELEDLAAAREVCPRAAESAARFYGEHHPVVAVAHNNLALLARLAGEPELSLAHEHVALQVCRDAVEPRHPYVAFAYVGLAESLLMLGRPHDALEPALRVLALRSDSQDLGDVAEARCLVARALGDRAGIGEALAELERAGTKQRQARACAASLASE